MSLKNDCLAILSWCYSNGGVGPSYIVISEACGIPLTTTKRILRGWREFGETNWSLANYAYKFGFVVTWIGRPGELIFVDRWRKADGTKHPGS